MSLTAATCVIIGAILCSGLLYIMTWHWRRQRLYELASKFKGPPVLPFVGNAHLFVGSGEYILSKITELSNLYPSPFRAWLGPKLYLYVADPELIKGVCLSPKTLEKGKVFIDFGSPWIGAGLILSPASIWKVHRKIIQPTFNARTLDSFVEVFAAQSKILTDQIERNLDGPEFEIFTLISRYALDVICETAMGVKIEAQTNRDCYYVEAAQNVIGGVCKRIFSIWLHPDFSFYLSKVGRDQRKYIKYLHDFTNNVIQMRKNELFERNSRSYTADDESNASESTMQKKTFLDHLLTLPRGTARLSDQAIREEVDTMILAGNETSANAISYVMWMLANHQDIQEKAYQELFEIYGDDEVEERPVAAKDLSRMKYLECVIRETLRLFPVVPFIIREVTDDLELGEHTLPCGSSVLIGILGLHRSEKYWPDPLRFDPDRFLPEEIAKRHPYAYMAFSGGPRNCIGSVHGMMSMKTLLATLLRRYTLKKDNITPVKDIRLKMEIVLKPVDPFKLRIEGRLQRN